MAHQADIPEGKGERVLVVDDEPRIVGFIERWLDDLGYQVRVLTRPEAVLELLRAEPDRYDLVMTDCLMPGMSGMDLHKALLKDAPDQAGRMVFMTGGAFTERARAFLDHVPNPSIGKPFLADELLGLVRDLLR